MSILHYIAPKKYNQKNNNINNFIIYLNGKNGLDKTSSSSSSSQKRKKSIKKSVVSVLKNFTIKKPNKTILTKKIISDVKKEKVRDYFNEFNTVNDEVEHLTNAIKNPDNFLIFITDEKYKINSFCIVNFSNENMNVKNIYFKPKYSENDNINELFGLIGGFGNQYINRENIVIIGSKKPSSYVMSVIKHYIGLDYNSTTNDDNGIDP